MNILTKLITPVISIGAGFVANKLVDSVWEKSTGSKPPKDADDLSNTFRSALIFSIVSAVVGAVIQTSVSRGAQQAVSRYDNSRDKV